LNQNPNPDPVNRWATEHYGFDDEPTPPAPAAHTEAPRAPAAERSAHPRRRSALVGGAVVGVLASAAGLGAISMAGNAADGGPGDRGNTSTVTDVNRVRADDRGPGSGGLRRAPDAGGPDGGLGGGRR
jgi:hypothetical protein